MQNAYAITCGKIGTAPLLSDYTSSDRGWSKSVCYAIFAIAGHGAKS